MLSGLAKRSEWSEEDDGCCKTLIMGSAQSSNSQDGSRETWEEYTSMNTL